jgi:hypothetical protein
VNAEVANSGWLLQLLGGHGDFNARLREVARPQILDCIEREPPGLNDLRASEGYSVRIMRDSTRNFLTFYAIFALKLLTVD